MQSVQTFLRRLMGPVVPAVIFLALIGATIPAQAQANPATFVNPSFYQAGNILANYSPIGVQELAVGDFNNDGFQDVVVIDSNANVNGFGNVTLQRRFLEQCSKSDLGDVFFVNGCAEPRAKYYR